MTAAEEVIDIVQLNPRMKVKLVAPGHLPHWTLQANRVPVDQRNLFARFLHLAPVREAKPIPQLYRKGWVMLQFHNHDFMAVESAVGIIAEGLGLPIEEGQFSHLDFLPGSTAYVPDWLDNLMGHRERTILHHPAAQFLQVDGDGTRLPAHQQWIESPAGTMLIDSHARKILA